LFKVSDKTEIILQGDYLKDYWTLILELNHRKKILDLPRNLYLGATWSNGETNQATVSGLVTHNFNKDWN
jgi:iron complex outermembrane receptor protein